MNLSEGELVPEPPPPPDLDDVTVHVPFRFPSWAPPVFFLCLALIFLWRSVIAGDVFLPATLLGHVSPWKSMSLYAQLPPWNPLRWDGIGQFYPWRKFASEILRSGFVPLWNPYQFCGTPFAANSQSAVFYPGNLLFVVIPDTAYAFGWSAALHLTLCGWFTYLLLRRFGCSEIGSLLGGVVYAYSSWQIAWLQLPTFLATSCWFPLLLRQTHAILDCRFCLRSDRSATQSSGEVLSRRTGVGVTICRLGGVIGLMLLAGHLQIALYGLITSACLMSGLLVVRRLTAAGPIVWCAALLLGLMLAMPQILPAIELSRISHRVGKPSSTGYAAYTDYALPAAGLIQILLPGFFGGDSDSANPFWAYYRMQVPGGSIAVYHNPAETAIYVGIIPLILGVFALVRGPRRGETDRRTLFFALLALLALLLAFGTPLNAILYFGVPGFSQSGSPARCLVLWALASAALAALGADTLSKQFANKRELIIVLVIIAAIAGLGLNLGARASMAPPPGLKHIPLIGEVFGRIGADWIRLALFLVAGILLLKGFVGKGATVPSARRSISQLAPWAALALVILDLFWNGIGSNPTAKREQVYPETPGIAYLRERAGHERIFPINQRWSLFAAMPFNLPDVLPPNSATVFGLRDVQGYDSLFSGRYKAFANEFARPNKFGKPDASPIEVGNMVFFQNANAPRVSDTSAAFAVAALYDQPGFPKGFVPPTTPVDTSDLGMTVYELPKTGGRARLEPSQLGSTITWLTDGPTRVRLAADTRVPAKLSLLDSAMPGWRLFVDDRPTGIITAYDKPVSRSVNISEGHHIVDFRYEPASFHFGLYSACIALSFIVLNVACCFVLRWEPTVQQECAPDSG